MTNATVALYELVFLFCLKAEPEFNLLFTLLTFIPWVSACS
jgi:hypothetical protein